MPGSLRERAFEIHALVEDMQGQLEDENGPVEARLVLARVDGQMMEFLRALEGVQAGDPPRKRGRRPRKGQAKEQGEGSGEEEPKLVE